MKAPIDICVYGKDYGCVISTRASQYGPALVARRVWVELPDDVEIDNSTFNGRKDYMMGICRPNHDDHDGRGDTCQVNIHGDRQTDYGYTGVYVDTSNIDAIKAEIDKRIGQGLTITMPDDTGRRITVGIKIVADDGYLNYYRV